MTATEKYLNEQEAKLMLKDLEQNLDTYFAKELHLKGEALNNLRTKIIQALTACVFSLTQADAKHVVVAIAKLQDILTIIEPEFTKRMDAIGKLMGNTDNNIKNIMDDLFKEH